MARPTFASGSRRNDLKGMARLRCGLAFMSGALLCLTRSGGNDWGRCRLGLRCGSLKARPHRAISGWSFAEKQLDRFPDGYKKCLAYKSLGAALKTLITIAAAIAAFGFASSASATDLSTSAADMPTEMPVNSPMAAPIFDWTGFHLGLNTSYNFSNNKLTTLTGLGWTSIPDPDAFGIGGQFGYRYQIAPGIVLGLEGDMSWLSANTGRALYNRNDGLIGGDEGQTQLTWDAGVRGQLGYSMGRFLPYLTGGLALIHEKGCVGVPGGACYATKSYNSTRAGWTAGVGLAYALTNAWIVNGEYRYADFGSKTYVTGDGTKPTSNLQVQKVLLGLSYQF